MPDPRYCRELSEADKVKMQELRKLRTQNLDNANKALTNPTRQALFNDKAAANLRSAWALVNQSGGAAIVAAILASATAGVQDDIINARTLRAMADRLDARGQETTMLVAPPPVFRTPRASKSSIALPVTSQAACLCVCLKSYDIIEQH